MDNQKVFTKHIGIVSITTVGACICANEIVAAAARRDSSCSGKHPEYTMHTFPFNEYKACVLKKDWNTMADIILRSIMKLKAAGADFIIMPSNTPHYEIQTIKNRSPLPVVNLIELTADECLSKRYKSIAVLGTKATMQDGLYNNMLLSRGISPIIPNDTMCKKIDNLIMNEIIPSKINMTTVKEIAQDIKKLNCEAIILGCTELPEVYDEHSLGVPVIDTTRLLAQKALDIATQFESWKQFISC